jgi:hypothetical protein
VRIVEFDSSNADSSDDGTNNLLTVLNFLKTRSEEKNLKPVVSTRSLINMVRNTGHHDFNYDTLIAANENPTVKNMIATMTKDSVELTSNLDSDSVQNKPIQNTDSPVNTVSSMAKRALNKRS